MIIGNALTTIGVIARSSGATRALLEKNSRVKKFKKGEHIFNDKDDDVALFGIIDGTVAVYKMSTSGEKRGIFIFGAGNLLNEDCMYGFHVSADAEVLRDSDILCVNMNAFEAACAKDPELSKAVMESVSMKVRRLYHLMKNTSNNLRGDRRIAAKLWKLSPMFRRTRKSSVIRTYFA
jgi:CRP-like cAMP-binding protein